MLRGIPHQETFKRYFYLSSSLISESWSQNSQSKYCWIAVRSSLTFDTSPPSLTPTASAGAGIKRRVAVLRCLIIVRRERTRISYLVQTSVLIFLFNVTAGFRRIVKWKELSVKKYLL